MLANHKLLFRIVLHYVFDILQPGNRQWLGSVQVGGLLDVLANKECSLPQRGRLNSLLRNKRLLVDFRCENRYTNMSDNYKPLFRKVPNFELDILQRGSLKFLGNVAVLVAVFANTVGNSQDTGFGTGFADDGDFGSDFDSGFGTGNPAGFDIGFGSGFGFDSGFGTVLGTSFDNKLGTGFGNNTRC